MHVHFKIRPKKNSEQLSAVYLFSIVNSGWKIKATSSRRLENNFLGLGKVECKMIMPLRQKIIISCKNHKTDSKDHNRQTKLTLPDSVSVGCRLRRNEDNNGCGKQAADARVSSAGNVIVNCSSSSAIWSHRGGTAERADGGGIRWRRTASLVRMSSTSTNQLPYRGGALVVQLSQRKAMTTTTTVLLGAQATNNCRASWASHPPRCRLASFYLHQFRFLLLRRTGSADDGHFSVSVGGRCRSEENAEWHSAAPGRKGAVRRRPPTNHSAPFIHKPSSAFEVLILWRAMTSFRKLHDGGMGCNWNERTLNSTLPPFVCLTHAISTVLLEVGLVKWLSGWNVQIYVKEKQQQKHIQYLDELFALVSYPYAPLCVSAEIISK